MSGKNSPSYGKKANKKTLLKMSQAHKGFKHTEKTKRKIKRANMKFWLNHPEKKLVGNNNPFYGKHHTKKTKNKIGNSNYHKNIKGKNNPNFNNHKLKGHKLTSKQCQKISKWRKENQFKENNPMWNKKHSNGTKIKMKNTLRNHHIYLKENDPKTMKLPTKKHMQLHFRAYDYLYYKYGKKGINNYLKWFDQRYGLRKNDKT